MALQVPTIEADRYAAKVAREAPTERAQIPQELDAVARQTDEVSELLAQLCQRLQPVLSPMGPSAEAMEPVNKESRAPIADVLHAHRMELSRQARELRGLLSALAL